MTSLFLLFTPSSTILAQTPPPSDDQVNQIARQLYCPVCENVPLDECPTAACQQWRNLIRQKLAEGWSEKDIKDYFLAQYGDRVLGEPPRKGLNWMLYILPPAVILVGLVLIVANLRRSPQEMPFQEAKGVDDYRVQVERDLAKMDES